MPTCAFCSKAASGCSYSEKRGLVPVCANCATSVVVWGSASQFMAHAAAALPSEKLMLARDEYREAFDRAYKWVLETQDIEGWRKRVDGAADALHDKLKKQLGKRGRRERECEAAAQLPLVATVAQPWISELAATPISKEQFARAHEQSLERARRLVGSDAITEYNTETFFAASDGEDTLHVITPERRYTIPFSPFMSVDGPVSPGAVCAASALLEERGYDSHCASFFMFGIRSAPPSLVVWNFTTSHMLTVALPPGEVRAATFSSAVVDGLLYLRAKYTDSPHAYFTVPAALVYAHQS